MSSGLKLKGSTSIGDVKRQIQAAPVKIATQVASRGSRELTSQVRRSYDTGQTAYGDPRPLGEDGEPLTLVQSGATRRALGFTAAGTRMRAALGTRYAKFLIGRYAILPAGGIGSLPVAWGRALSRIAGEVES